MQFADDNSQVIREYIVPWASVYDTIKNLLGYPVIAGNTLAGTGYLQRWLPDDFSPLTTTEGGFEPEALLAVVYPGAGSDRGRPASTRRLADSRD